MYGITMTTRVTCEMTLRHKLRLVSHWRRVQWMCGPLATTAEGRRRLGSADVIELNLRHSFISRLLWRPVAIDKRLTY